MASKKSREKTGSKKPAPTAGGNFGKTSKKPAKKAGKAVKPAAASLVKLPKTSAGKPPAAAPPVPGGDTAKPSNFSANQPPPPPAPGNDRGLLTRDQSADSGGHDPSRPIGPGNPPRSTQFTPGISGNPKGYPKGKPNAATIIKYWLSRSEEIQNPISGEVENLSELDIMVLGMIKEARKGNVGAFRDLLDRTEGKPVQTTKLLGAGDKELNIVIGFAAPQQTATTKPE